MPDHNELTEANKYSWGWITVLAFMKRVMKQHKNYFKRTEEASKCWKLKIVLKWDTKNMSCKHVFEMCKFIPSVSVKYLVCNKVGIFH